MNQYQALISIREVQIVCGECNGIIDNKNSENKLYDFQDLTEETQFYCDNCKIEINLSLADQKLLQYKSNI